MKRFFKRTQALFTALCFTVLLTNGLGATKYAHPSGNNSWSGTTTNLSAPNGPKLTIDGLINVLAANDVGSIMGGTYVERIGGASIPSGTGSGYTYLSNYASQVVIVRPGAGGPALAISTSTQWRSNIYVTGITFDGVNISAGNAVIKSDQRSLFCVFSNISIINGPAHGFLTGYSTADGEYAHNLKLANSLISSNGHSFLSGDPPHAVYLSGSVYSNEISGNTIQKQRAGSSSSTPHLIHVYTGGPNVVARNKIFNNTMIGYSGNGSPGATYYGIGLYQSSDNYVYNNTLYDIYIGIYSAYNSDPTPQYIDNNTIFYCYVGLATDQVGTGLVWRNNIITRSGFGGLSIGSGSGTVYMSNNLSSQNFSNFRSNAPATMSGNLIGNQYDPKFANTNIQDFTLLTGSSAIGTGLTLSSLFTTDKAGTTRTAPWTIGAYAASAGATPIFSISAGSEFAYELNAVPGTFTVSRNTSSVAVTNLFALTNGTAVPGTHFVTVPLSNVMAIGVSNFTITITPIDLASSVDRTVGLILLTNGSNYQLQDPTNRTMTIVANPPASSTPATGQRIKTR